MNKGYKSDKIDIDFMDKRGSGIVENQEVYTFNSSDGHSLIHCRKWLPEGTPVAVVQIVHGMVEYIDMINLLSSLHQRVMLWLLMII